MKHSKNTFSKNYVVIGNKIKTFYDEIMKADVKKSIASHLSDVQMEYKDLIRSMVLADALKCTEKSVSLSTIPDEMAAFEYLLYVMSEDCNVPFDDWRNSNEVQEGIKSIEESLRQAFPYDNDTFGAFILVKVLADCGLNTLAAEYFKWMYELSKCVTYADGKVSKLESVWMEVLDFYKPIIESRAEIAMMAKGTKKFSSRVDYKEDEVTDEDDTYELDDDELDEDEVDDNEVNANEVDANDDVEDETETEAEENEEQDPMEQLSELIGLEAVKSDVKSLKNLLRMQRLRESKGLKAAKVSYHCVFTGNPGTGKTTVARILASIYKDLGILKKGQLIETDRSGLVADYVGQTATKTNAIIDNALDGVLFIDEAYALAQGGDNDFGKEAISTLLKRMEDDRKRLVVILAGYSKEMEEFINANSGLQSRFSRYINFPDYSVNELCDIFRLFLKQNDYVISDVAMNKVKDKIVAAYEVKDSKFGNARFVRNLFEEIITNQANRLAEKDDISKKEMTEIITEDIN